VTTSIGESNDGYTDVHSRSREWPGIDTARCEQCKRTDRASSLRKLRRERLGSWPDLDDWLNAERELIIKPVPVVRAHGADIFVEMLLPEIDLPNLTVHVAPSQLVISSDPDEDGLQLCQMIDLPCEISLDGVDAEQLHNMLHVTAAVAQPQPEPA